MPIIHGSGDFAVQVREELLSRPYDCVAVPLPPSFQEDVEAAIEELPRVSIVVQVDAETDESESEAGFSYVPIDPCQGVIAALRTARASGSRGNSSTWRRRDSWRSPAHFPIRTRSSGSARGSSRPRSCTPFRGLSPARIPIGSTGWRLACASSNRAIGRSSWSARSSTGPGSARHTAMPRLHPSKSRFLRRS